MNLLFAKLKLWIKILVGKEFYASVDITLDMKRYGSAYGGWDVIGDSLGPDSVVYSCGVGEDASFDIELINEFDLEIYAFDPTPRSILWVKQQNFSCKFIMYEYGIADFNGDAKFTPPTNPNHVSHTMLECPQSEDSAIVVPMKRLETIMHELGHTDIDILKLDIEGAEYSVINDLHDGNIRPKQILVEFHHRFDNVGIAQTQQAIRQLKSIGYKLFSVSSSNEEFCFVHESKQLNTSGFD